MDHRHHEPVRKPSFKAMTEEVIDMNPIPVDYESAALLKFPSFTDKQSFQKQLETTSTRWAGYSETHPAAQLLDILQESTTILRKHDNLLLALALFLAVPVSTTLLSHVLLLLPFINPMVSSLQFTAEQRFGQNSTGYRRVAEVVTSSVVGIPFSALFSPLLKAGVGYVVAASYGRKKVKSADVIEVLQKMWVVLLQTSLWTCSVYVAFASAFGVLLWWVARVDAASSGSSLLVAAFVAVALAAGMAVANVVCNVGYIVSVLEGCSGRQALVRSANLLKGRVEVALLLFLVTTVNGTLLDVIFEFHILRNGNAEVVIEKYWEAPLLVGMHSFVHLFDAIMISVLYFICNSSSSSTSEMVLPTDPSRHPAVELLAATNDSLILEVRSPLARGSPLASRSFGSR